MIISSLVGGRDDGEIEATGGGRCKKAKKQAMITWADDYDADIEYKAIKKGATPAQRVPLRLPDGAVEQNYTGS